MSIPSAVKSAVQRSIRSVHVALFDRGVPDRVAIYLHSVETEDHDRLKGMIRLFQTLGYEFVLPNSFFEPGCEKKVFLSFDDNYRSWLALIPVLEQCQVQATFYVNTSVLRDRATLDQIAIYYRGIGHHREWIPLSTSELRQLRSAGHVIGSHARTHQVLAALPEKQARAEISESKIELEEILGERIQHFSYPFGMRRHFSEALRQYCAAAGYETVANAIPGMQHAGQQPLSIHRSPWAVSRPDAYNLQNISIDGSLFEELTGRSAIGGLQEASRKANEPNQPFSVPTWP